MALGIHRSRYAACALTGLVLTLAHSTNAHELDGPSLLQSSAFSRSS